MAYKCLSYYVDSKYHKVQVKYVDNKIAVAG